MQEEILAKHPTANIHVYVVWFSMLPLDRRGAWDDGVMPDHRVTHLWDSHRLVSGWVATNIQDTHRYVWDTYLLYGPEATWENVPSPLIGTDGTVIGSRQELHAQLLPLLGP